MTRDAESTYGDLEIGLNQPELDGYNLEMRYTVQSSDQTLGWPQDKAATRVYFKREELLAREADAEEYGKYLTAHLFADAGALAWFAGKRGRADVLRVRLNIGPSAPALHDIRWETLRDPEDGSPLCQKERVLFSRFLLPSDTISQQETRALSELRALVVIANPNGLEPWGAAPINVPGELKRATTSLDKIQFTSLASDGSATLVNLSNQLRDGYDILYLVCHGRRGENNQPTLLLEDEHCNVKAVTGSELVDELAGLQKRPRLVVLASCQSAGSSSSADQGALATVGPLLAAKGVAAVIAMQGNVLMQTVEKFMPVFFRELQRDGRIDRAVAAARRAAREQIDWWAPTLFMNLKEGRISWYEPGFVGDPQGFKKWPSLLQQIESGQCTPILGPGFLESLLGSPREIARRWTEEYNYPLARYYGEDLPHVAQYVAVEQNTGFPHKELANYLRSDIVQRYGKLLGDEIRLHPPPLEQLLEAVGAHRQQLDPAEPHTVLAKLPFKIYVTTNPDNLLEKALVAEGRQPVSVLCPWNEDIEQRTSIYAQEPEYKASIKRPLVYHLFGDLFVPESLVLTEDDYFDFLVGVTKNNELIPIELRAALANSGLLFLGFELDDWNFRALFRSPLIKGSSNLRLTFTNIAAQIRPDSERALNLEVARTYLESYFNQAAHVSIYWGSVEDFMRDLLPRWVKRLQGGGAGAEDTPGGRPSMAQLLARLQAAAKETHS